MAGGSDAVIGTIAGNHDRTSAAQLDRLGQTASEVHVASVRRVALDRLVNEDPDRCVGGIDVWTASLTGRISLLCVQESFAFPARVTRSDRRLHPAGDIEHPNVLRRDRRGDRGGSTGRL